MIWASRYPLAIVAIAMAADLVTFALAVPHVGIEQEANPIMAAAYIHSGVASVALLKAVGTVAICLAVLRVSRPPLRFLTAVFGASFGVIGTIANVTAWSLS